MRQKPLRKRLLWWLGAEAMLRRAAAVHYTTAEEQRLVETSLALGRGVVVPLGVSRELLEDKTSSDFFRRDHPALGEKPYVLVLSRLDPKKGLEVLIEAFLELTSGADFRDWRLVLAGSGESAYESTLNRLVNIRGGNERVVFTGWISGATKMSALRGADLVALPSRQENFGLSVIEALACQVPVLISPQVNLAEEIQNSRAGWLAPLDVRGQITVLTEALSDKTERLRRGAAGRALVAERFTWTSVGSQLAELYASIMADGVASARAQ
jgi:glycosyltransferase involved in cell wall biosynthesis